ncbi:hypothetical protein GQ53DRAFT_753067 [Thozetella sp. PMI_491]|nr:hypothetical protein GQ53DRAFT_753067 [Thozetella sp. PMI_491]
MASEDSAPVGEVSVKLIHDPKDANGAFLNCADVFVILTPGAENLLSTWTDLESGTFWPRDLVPKDTELRERCRIWTLTMHDVDARLKTFQECVWMQNFAGGALNAIDHRLTSETPYAAPEEGTGSPQGKRPNNGTVVLVAHGLGGILATTTASLILELPSEVMQGHCLGLKRKHWRVILLGTPHFGEDSNPLEAMDQFSGIMAYYGGTTAGSDFWHTWAWWKGLQQHGLCLIHGNWAEKSLAAPTDPHGTLQVASFQEGEQDESLAQERKSMRPNDPDINGLAVQESFSLFGGTALCGFSMSDAPSPTLPRKHKVSNSRWSCAGHYDANVSPIENMGRFKDENDPCYLALRAVLKEMVKPE